MCTNEPPLVISIEPVSPKRILDKMPQECKYMLFNEGYLKNVMAYLCIFSQ